MLLNYKKNQNQIQDFKINLHDLNKLLQNVKPSFNNKFKVPWVEKKKGFPPFVGLFYDFISKGIFLSQRDFIEKYLELNKNDENVIESTETLYLKNGLMYRLGKAYTSIVRDFHFMIYLKEKTNYDIFYNTKYDLENDIDVGIKHNNKLYGLCLHVGGYNSEFHRDKKKSRHRRFNNVTYIEITINDKDKKSDGIWLYGENHLNLIDDNISQNHFTN